MAGIWNNRPRHIVLAVLLLMEISTVLTRSFREKNTAESLDGKERKMRQD